MSKTAASKDEESVLGLKDNEIKLLIAATQCLQGNAEFKVDTKQLAEKTGYKDAKSANTAWYRLRNKLWPQAGSGANGEGESAAGTNEQATSKPKTPRKPKSNMDDEKPKTAKKTKKAASDKVENEAGADEADEAVAAESSSDVKSEKSGEDVEMTSGAAEDGHSATITEPTTPAVMTADAGMSAPATPAPKTPVGATIASENTAATPTKSSGKKRVRRTKKQIEAAKAAEDAKVAGDANTDDVSDTEKQHASKKVKKTPAKTIKPTKETTTDAAKDDEADVDATTPTKKKTATPRKPKGKAAKDTELVAAAAIGYVEASEADAAAAAQEAADAVSKNEIVDSIEKDDETTKTTIEASKDNADNSIKGTVIGKESDGDTIVVVEQGQTQGQGVSTGDTIQVQD